MMEKQREELRRRVTEIQSYKHTRCHYPEQLRQAVCSYTRERLCGGDQCSAICRELCLSPAIVKRWMRQRFETPTGQQAGMFRAVAVVREEPRPRAENIFGSASCSLTSPAGYRVEGLGVAQIVYLLRELR